MLHTSQISSCDDEIMTSEREQVVVKKGVKMTIRIADSNSVLWSSESGVDLPGGYNSWIGRGSHLVLVSFDKKLDKSPIQE
jgi:hypothetical protein